MKSVNSEKTAARELAADDCGLPPVPGDAPVPEAFRLRPPRELMGDDLLDALLERSRAQLRQAIANTRLSG